MSHFYRFAETFLKSPVSFRPLCLIVLGCLALFIVAGVIALALIPIYLTDRGLHMTIKSETSSSHMALATDPLILDSCKEQTLVFVIPGTTGVQDGVLSQEKTLQLGAIVCSCVVEYHFSDLSFPFFSYKVKFSQCWSMTLKKVTSRSPKSK